MKYFKKILPRKRSRMTKRVLGFLAIFALSGLFFQTNVGTAEVHAQTVQTNETPQTSISSMGLVDILDLILKVVYILLWPLLVVAGWAMDNTLVYGQIFNLDVPLWKFRNILKNFANFTLGFLVLFAILKSIFTNSGMGSLKDSKTPLGIIKKTLIAGILIQASWFLIAATIDVSTVATYAVGGLPLNVLKTTPLGQKKILAVDAKIDFNKIQNLNDKGDILSLTYAAGPNKLSACQLSTNEEGGAARYIVGRKNGSGTLPGMCVFGGNTVVTFDETGLQALELAPYANDGLSGGGSTPENYLLFSQGKAQSCVPSSELVRRGMIIDIYSGASFSGAKAAGQKRFDGTPAMMLSELVNRSKGFVGPMVTIYSSLLNFAEISDSGNDSFGKVSGEMIIRAAFAVMLFFPLLALAVVLIIRVGFLWLVIAASPFIVLLETFKETLKLPADFKLGEHLKLPNIISVIFAPVITVFALSLAVIFITTLINTLTPNGAHNNTIDAILAPQIVKQPTTDGSQKYLVGGSQMTLSNFNRGGNLDRFSRIIVNLVAVGLMRALVFAAIKSNKLGDKIGGGIEKRGGNFMSTLPIVSIPGQDKKVGFGSIANVVSDTPDRYISHIKGEQEEIGRKFADAKFGIDEDDGTKTKITQEQHTAIASGLKSGPDIKSQIDKINEGRKEDEQITIDQYLSDTKNLDALNTVIAGMGSEKGSALTNAAKEWGDHVFQRKLDAGALPDELTTLLNDKNEIIKTYAKSQEGNTVEGKDADGAPKKYTISLDAKNQYVVTDTAPAANKTEKPK